MADVGVFDDARLEDPRALAEADAQLRWLATAGARIRMTAAGMAAAGSAERLLESFDLGRRPRGVLVVGGEARLIRAVLEPICPVPLVAWPFDSLPGWVGALDLVVVLAATGSHPGLQSIASEARRRGAPLLVAAAPGSAVAELAASRSTLVLPVPTSDPLSAAVGVLEFLHALGLGPAVSPELVAEAVDAVAEQCSPHIDLAHNPAKELALGLADALPLVWGGSVLSARASRRIAEALRLAGGRPALAADASDLVPLVAAAHRRDPFADPFDGGHDEPLRPVLVLLDEDSDSPSVRRDRGILAALADEHDVRIRVVRGTSPGQRPVATYAALLMHGLYGAAYLAIGLGRPGSAHGF
ncbi:MAG: hypothetical protein M0Z51_05010 [Propionibacterium sp.]|nr:hypothetical protein [Propionibacterium sp.]